MKQVNLPSPVGRPFMMGTLALMKLIEGMGEKMAAVTLKSNLILCDNCRITITLQNASAFSLHFRVLTYLTFIVRFTEAFQFKLTEVKLAPK